MIVHEMRMKLSILSATKNQHVDNQLRLIERKKRNFSKNYISYSLSRHNEKYKQTLIGLASDCSYIFATYGLPDCFCSPTVATPDMIYIKGFRGHSLQITVTHKMQSTTHVKKDEKKENVRKTE